MLVSNPSAIGSLRVSFYIGTNTDQSIELFVADVASRDDKPPVDCYAPDMVVTDHFDDVHIDDLRLSHEDVIPKDSVWIGVPRFDEMWKEVSVDLSELGSSPKYLLFGIRTPWDDVHNLRVVPAFGPAYDAVESSWMSLDDGETWECTAESAVLDKFELLPEDNGGGGGGGGGGGEGCEDGEGCEGGEGEAGPPLPLPGQANQYLHILIDPEEPR